jgi:hypothetical protein
MADILTLSPDELASLLNDMVEFAETLGFDNGSPMEARRSVLALNDVAAEMRRNMLVRAAPDAAELISLRQIFYDRGVFPYGYNTSYGPGLAVLGKGRAKPAAGDGVGRPPVSRELWVDRAPPTAAGYAFSAWATAAGANDRVDVDAVVVVPAFLGRGNTPTFKGGVETVYAIDTVSSGRWNGGTLVTSGFLAAATRQGRKAQKRRNTPSSASALAWLSEQASSLYRPAAAPALEVYPDLRDNRLGDKSYTNSWARGVAFVADASDGPPRALARALNDVYDYAESGAGFALVLAALGLPSRRRPLPPKTVSLQPRALTYALLGVKETAEVEGEYQQTVEWLAGQIADAFDQPGKLFTNNPLDAATYIYSNNGTSTLRDLLTLSFRKKNPSSRRAVVEPFIRQLKQEIANGRNEEAATLREQETVVQARQYLIIAEKKFGSANYLAVMQTILGDPVYDIDNPRSVLDAVEASTASAHFKRSKKHAAAKAAGVSARHLVTTEYDNQIKEWEMQASNKCPHVALVRRFRAAESLDDVRRAYASLRRYFVEQKDLPGSPEQAARDMTWVACHNCNYQVVCPHVIELYRLQQARVSYEELRDGLAKYASRTDYTGRGAKTGENAYYCSVCSEQLYTRVPNSGDELSGARATGQVGSLDNDLRTYLWSECMKVVDPRAGGAPLLEFSQPVDPRRFSADAATICHPLTVTAKVSRNAARGGALQVQGRLRDELLGVIYIYTYFFSLVLDSAIAGSVTGGVRTKLSGVRDSAAPDVKAQILLSHLVETHGALLSRIENVSNEQIGNQFQVAYRHLLDSNGRVLLVSQDAPRIFLTNVAQLDPYYAALSTAVRIVADPGKKPHVGMPPAAAYKNTLQASAAAREFEYIMGDTMVNLTTAVFSKYLMPFVRIALANRGGVEYPAGVSPDWAYKVPELGLYRKAWGTRDGRAKKYWDGIVATVYAANGGAAGVAALGATNVPYLPIWVGGRQPKRKKASELIARKGGVKRKKTSEMITRRKERAVSGARAVSGVRAVSDVRGGKLDLPESYEGAGTAVYFDALYLTVLYATHVHDDDSWAYYERVLRVARLRDREYEKSRGLHILPPFASGLVCGVLKNYYAPVRITRLYDENGNRHVWSIYLWRNAEGAAVRYTSKEHVDMLLAAARKGEPSALVGYEFSDWVCSTCGVEQKKTDEIDMGKTVKHLRIKSRLESFFLYYETRCPEEGLHVFENTKGRNVCKKCGAGTELFTHQRERSFPQEAIAYFDKYVAVFEKFVLAGQSVEVPKRAVEAAAAPVVAAKKKPASTHSVAALSELLRKAGADVTSAELNAIGSTERRSAEDVKNGDQIPPPPRSLDDPRIASADSNYRLLLTRYCVLVFKSAEQPALPWVRKLLPADDDSRVAELPRPSALGTAEKYFKPLQSLFAAARLAPQDPDSVASTFAEHNYTPGGWSDAILDFVIDQFCRLALDIADKGGALGLDFVVLVVQEIMRNESRFTIPGEFKWSVFGDLPGSDGETADISMGVGDSSQDDVASFGAGAEGTEDVTREAAHDRAAGKGPTDAFGMDSIDIDPDIAASNID